MTLPSHSAIAAWPVDKWADVAHAAFILGMEDGLVLSKPRTAATIINQLPPIPDGRMVHTHKLRQVYGAGFDIAQSNARIRAGG